MQLCINYSCPKPADPLNENNQICRHCGSELLLQKRYRVTRLISDNTGFGNIYEVDDQGTPKILKVLKENHNTNSKAVKLFQQEAAVLRQLNHPGIPKVDGYFQLRLKNVSSGQTPPILHCIVMEKINGLNLEEWQKKRGNKPLAQLQAINWLRQIVEILDLVHKHSYFHRDIKPPNIMLRSTGHLVLIDFGSTREMTYTYFGKVGGTGKVTKLTSAGYTPPEQDNGHAVPQSDFYALGRTFVYLLTGKQPTESAIYDPYNDELCWRTHTRAISPQLADLIDDLMAHKAGNRPKNTQEILQRLDYIAQNLYPPPPLHFPQLNIKWIVSGVIIGLIAGLGGVGTYCQTQFNSDPIALVTSLSLLKTTLRGHSNYVHSVAFSPDGKTLASGSDDNTIKIWDLSTGQPISTVSPHSSWFFSVAFSPDGQTLASGSDNNTIQIWNLPIKQQLRTLTGHTSYVDSVAFSPDGQTLASGSGDYTIKIWKFDTGQLLRTLKGHSDSVGSIAFSPDGQILASGSNDKTIKIWSLSTGQIIRTLTGHDDTVSSVAFSPDGQTLASGSWDKTIKIWNLSTGQKTRTLTGHDDSVSSVAFSPDGQTLASGSWDKTIKIWNLSTGQLIRTLTGHSDSVTSVAFSPDGQTLASSSNDNSIKIWRVGVTKN